VSESEDNVVVDVAAGLKRPAADGLGSEILHDDGSVTRLSPDAVAEASSGVLRLQRGSAWHEPPVSAPGQRFKVELGRASVTTENGVLAIVAEADGSSFITAVEGSLTIEGPGAPVELSQLQAAQLSGTGDLLDLIGATEEELQKDPWIGRNVALSSARPVLDTVVMPPPPTPPTEWPETEPLETEPLETESPGIESPDTESLEAEPVAVPEVEPQPGPTAETDLEPIEAAAPAAADVEADSTPPAGTAKARKERRPAAGPAKRRRRRTVLGLVALGVGVVIVVAAVAVGLSNNNSKGSSATPEQIAQRVSVKPTRCASDNDQLVVEGTVTNLDTATHSYRIHVVFTGPPTPPGASVDVHKVKPNKPAGWKAATPFKGDLATITGCQVSQVQPISG